ncbi:MAG: hypothetical protein A2589_00200 [Candidatus Vogelbacteria bacterium RIFOXYD1_FULL_46_19]|uniref:DUF5652 domain-containing protein n=1 Tax=Candidatus Vogelbacteria bacterium RIFOXYD1_FULL_46_19 TaxID=1802439 RepID=A0A1G2QIB0_9BACT|nr:MAG: hypothetical protein A2589_00200 [Candidatus Vogelbacteria bacterium RIFOXYD1_FULL_46_19]
MENPNDILVFASLFWGVILVLIVWSTVWKGLALWQAARRGDKGWYIAMLILQTAGILEIIYLVFVAKFFSGWKTSARPVTTQQSVPTPAQVSSSETVSAEHNTTSSV